MKTATLTLPVVCLVAVLQTGALPTEAAAAHGLRTTDYYLSHESKEPFYRQHNLSPDVVVHVRDVVAPGNERTAGKNNKVLLFMHGATFPASVAFDLDYGNASMMRLARSGLFNSCPP